MRARWYGRLVSRRGSMLLLPAAAFTVHQLRYWLAYGSGANAELAAQGHSYLSSLVPWTIFALALGAGSFLRRLARTLRTGEQVQEGRLPAGALWLASWLGLLAVYATQETLEALLLTGHPGGTAGVLGHGGWWAVPVAAVVALAVTALLAVGRVILRAVAAAHRARRSTSVALPAPAGVATAVVRPLARAAAGRAPPLVPVPG